MKLMVGPSVVGAAGASAGAAGDYTQGSLPYVEYAVAIPIGQNDTLSVMAGI